MKIVLIIPQKDFKDETVVELITTFKKWKVEYVVASSTIGVCSGYHGAEINATINYSNIRSDEFDGIIISNGPGVEEYKLYNSRSLLDVIKFFNEKNKIIACIGNSIKILSRANIINNKKIAMIKDLELTRLIKLFRGIITDNLVEQDGNLITASNSEKINEFSKLIIEKLNLI